MINLWDPLISIISIIQSASGAGRSLQSGGPKYGSLLSCHPSVCQFPPHPVYHCTGVSAPKNALLLDHIQYNGRFTGHTSTILDHTSTMVSTDSVKIHHRLMMLIQKALLSQPHGHGIEAPQLCPSDKVELCRVRGLQWPPPCGAPGT